MCVSSRIWRIYHLKIFIVSVRCNLCHLGPRFSNGEFGDVGIPYFTVDGVDPGRYGGIQQVRANPYNLLGKYNDGDPGQNAVSSSHVRLTHRNWGEFKIPGLRAVAATAPYMHNGSLPTLRDVVLHYSNFDEERLHTDGEKILRPLKLTHNDLVHFGRHKAQPSIIAARPNTPRVLAPRMSVLLMRRV